MYKGSFNLSVKGIDKRGEVEGKGRENGGKP
jgi:hypothetical protein